MSESDIQVIIARFEDFKEVVNKRFDEINEKIGDKCDDCTKTPPLAIQIKGLWVLMGATLTVTGGAIVYFNDKLNGIIEKIAHIVR